MKTTSVVALFLLTEVLCLSAFSLVRNDHQQLPSLRAADKCASGFSPFCTCEDYYYGLILICNVTGSDDFDGIRKLFSANEYSNYFDVQFHMTASVDIPQDVLGGKTTQKQRLYCPDRSTPLGEIDAEAFKSTWEYTTSFELWNCDLNNFRFAFLSEFTNLTELGIYGSSLQKINDMPYLPKLNEIYFRDLTDFQFWYTPSQTPNLIKINIGSNQDLGDLKMDSILTSMTDNFIYSNLFYLYLSYNALTRVPPLAFSFPSLGYLYLNGNPIETLTTGSVNKTYNSLMYLELYSMALKTVEPGAFIGDFSTTNIGLEYNQMTSFPEFPFKEILESMVDHKYIDINVMDNPIADNCDLAWLILYNRGLLDYVFGELANGTDFRNLNALAYLDCPRTP